MLWYFQDLILGWLMLPLICALPARSCTLSHDTTLWFCVRWTTLALFVILAQIGLWQLWWMTQQERCSRSRKPGGCDGGQGWAAALYTLLQIETTLTVSRIVWTVWRHLGARRPNRRMWDWQGQNEAENSFDFQKQLQTPVDSFFCTNTARETCFSPPFGPSSPAPCTHTAH